jgi:endonuclease YncB( thermonuclease family)
MQPRHASIAALAILVMVVSVALGGRAVLRQQGGDFEEQATPAPAPAEPAEPATAAISKTQPERASAPSRAIDPEFARPPRPGTAPLERVEPRPPLSKLALATPPKPKMPDEWKGTTLFQPVATAAGLIEAKGYSIAVAGIEIVGEDETCHDHGQSWACGARARTAFRSFLRGRAVVCAVPPEGGRDLIAARCRIGKRDLGQWLVENGWARAAAGGPYVKAEDAARKAQKGIFGGPPDLSGLPPVPAPVEAVPAGQSSIIDLSGERVTPPTGQPAPFQ